MYSAKLLACVFILAASLAGVTGKKQVRTISPPIDLNTASPRDLQTLPGIGATTAKKIVAGRPYSSTSDLARVGVSRKTIAAITPMVTAGDFAGTSATNAPPPPPDKGMVWVNLGTRRYHKAGSRWYAATGNGKYMTEADAQRQGYRLSKD